MAVFSDVAASFILGLFTPLAAACVLPLYPGFLSYISSQLSGKTDSRKTFALIGVTVTAGVVLFMLLVGLIFTLILQKSLTSVIQIVSPIAFAILLVVSVLLIIDFDFSKIIPKAKTPFLKNPLLSAFSFGFFFGAVVIPCNPAFIIALLTRATVSVSGFFSGMLSFLAFGAGIGAPLLLFSLVSAAKSSTVIAFLTAQRRKINLAAGIFMLLVSLYYLIVVFGVLGSSPLIQYISKPLSFLFSWVGLFVPNVG
ncbi:cytochrome C biogenesis protein [Candidatus Woesearchaeota archaeon]|nr:cytochrome C biogenesis protein [Candidatus Woesearchaeota archaeon]